MDIPWQIGFAGLAVIGIVFFLAKKWWDKWWGWLIFAVSMGWLVAWFGWLRFL